MGDLSFNIIANGVWGPEGLSGGDDIFINFAKQLVGEKLTVNIFTWEDGYEMCKANGLRGGKFFLIRARKYQKLGFPALYFLRTILGIVKVREIIKKGEIDGRKIIIYSASDFWPDFLPAFFFKKWVPQAKWVAGFYLFAPNPLRGFRGELSLKNFLFWLTQKPIFWLVSKYANMICVTSKPDVVPFVKAGRKPEDIFVVKGGIDYQHLKQFQKPAKKIYDAVFVGRFHPQKGVVEMIDIWNEVVKKKPEVKLAIIGLGPMEAEMRKKIKECKLEENVKFLGVMLGDDRNKVLQKSKIILHPAVYDSGGMAAASGLACGLPGVCFDLPVFKTYYPCGFLRAEVGNIKDFAQKIIALLEDKKFYLKLRKEAIKEAETWDWNERVEKILDIIENLLNKDEKKPFLF